MLGGMGLILSRRDEELDFNMSLVLCICSQEVQWGRYLLSSYKKVGGGIGTVVKSDR